MSDKKTENERRQEAERAAGKETGANPTPHQERPPDPNEIPNNNPHPDWKGNNPSGAPVEDKSGESEQQPLPADQQLRKPDDKSDREKGRG